jgi:hypothetical protein
VEHSNIDVKVDSGHEVRPATNSRISDGSGAGSARHDHGPALFAGFLGWTLDAFDFFLVVLALTAIAHDFRRSDKEIAL